MASFAAVALMLSASMLAAQSTGKIEGRVRDNSGTPIANAQVFIVGTAFSALTNAQGYYFINNIPTGSVDMRAAFVGYRPVRVSGVLVRGGQTGTQDFALEASVVSVQDIVVTAERPLVPRDQVSTKPTVSGDMTDQLPVNRINDVLA
ncbi:MAG: carboxypeptidase-like regulatory domain-containing protein, partial [Gemmatimonadetes bacterium]|nr:carboxypeptidase-like regulatory domain-containing protein [Gemmatimonadota bacterium]